ncbi:MAG TPA: SDR family oxidoreductase [Gemmatimonadales bacterium]|jgi:NAD(P)-dependent dehydrogenase (short-subunit alcohol dehydrogenase family)|nr:SDR family oxidoreductase [Gemmatimonadales bacterium]
METVFVTGANRGIGLELARQCAARGDRVIATARRVESLAPLRAEFGERVLPLPLDVRDDRSIAAMREALSGRTHAVDLLCNCAGLYSLHSASWNAEATRFPTLSRDELNTVFDVNATGAMLVLKALLDLLLHADRPRVLNFSSLLGAVSVRQSGGDYAYAASKAALNIMTRSFAAEYRDAGIIAVAITPGWVHTDMGGADATLSPEESVRGLLRVAEGLTPAQSGLFLDYQGVRQPW